jgi:hypothetical protein
MLGKRAFPHPIEFSERIMGRMGYLVKGKRRKNVTLQSRAAKGHVLGLRGKAKRCPGLGARAFRSEP